MLASCIDKTSIIINMHIDLSAIWSIKTRVVRCNK
jgi:hypothetical protein